MRPIIALLTDFGTRDHYAGTMKAVVLGICADVTLVDLSHDIPPHDVLTAALELAASYKYFPTGTIFLVVVDPGVGSSRRGLAVDTGDYRFIAPDNGVLTAVLAETPPKRVVELTERRYARPTVSKTFEGRDRFAPAAGWLAKGVDLTALGRSAGEYQRLLIPAPAVTGTTLSGEVIRIDRFGNLVTNIDHKLFDKFTQSAAIEVTAGPHRIGRVVATYAEAPDGEPCALFGSTDHLEIAVNAASAAERLALTRGAPVTIRKI
ncbi:MAG TPA: SAM-dependent chlorinase/fluorinase [Vicinamibacterales bacterium]|nr:SAM-dependent chlorinase/fluorinase [Vicinamibacterales bacterium]